VGYRAAGGDDGGGGNKVGDEPNDDVTSLLAGVTTNSELGVDDGGGSNEVINELDDASPSDDGGNNASVVSVVGAGERVEDTPLPSTLAESTTTSASLLKSEILHVLLLSVPSALLPAKCNAIRIEPNSAGNRAEGTESTTFHVVFL
jgi:hypothetical protein